MSTCPHCKGHLTEGHRCPHRRGLIIAETMLAGLGGGLGGWLLVAAFDIHGQIKDLDAFGFAAGALIAVGLNRALRT